MLTKKNFALLFTAFILFVMCFSFPVLAEDTDCEGSACEDTTTDIDQICDDESCEDIEETEAYSDGIVLFADGNSVSHQLEDSIDSESIGAELSAVNGGTITFSATSDEGSAFIYGEIIGISVSTEGSGSSVKVNADGIDSEGTGIYINAGVGATVKVSNESSVSGYTAVDIINDGSMAELSAGNVEGVIGLGILASSGKTTADSGDITADGYGVLIDAIKAKDSDAPVVSVTVDGDITDSFAATPDDGSGIEQPDDPEDVYEGKDAEDPEAGWVDIDTDDMPDTGDGEWEYDWDADEEEAADEDIENSTGVSVVAEGEGTKVEVTVKGMISMEYGNEAEAYDKAAVSVSVQEDVVTDYGNRISAVDSGSEAKFEFGGDIDAGGKAIDTYADSGTVMVMVSGDITANDTDDGDFETVGIYSNSEGDGQTTIDVRKGITVTSAEDGYVAYGIDTANIGGTVTINVADKITVKGMEAVGISVVNDPLANAFTEELGKESVSESSDPVTNINVQGDVKAEGSADTNGMEVQNSDGKINITVNGDLSGSVNGLIIDAYGKDRTQSYADILVTGTISGKTAGVIVNDEADNDGTEDDNLNLTVWAIESGSSNAAQDENGKANETIEKNIQYIVRIDPDSVDKIEVVDENGDLLTVSHGYPVQKQEQRVYLQGKNGYDLTEAYNGKDTQTALL